MDLFKRSNKLRHCCTRSTHSNDLGNCNKTRATYKFTEQTIPIDDLAFRDDLEEFWNGSKYQYRSTFFSCLFCRKSCFPDYRIQNQRSIWQKNATGRIIVTNVIAIPSSLTPLNVLTFIIIIIMIIYILWVCISIPCRQDSWISYSIDSDKILRALCLTSRPTVLTINEPNITIKYISRSSGNNLKMCHLNVLWRFWFWRDIYESDDVNNLIASLEINCRALLDDHVL